MAPGKTNRRARASQASPWELKRSGASQGNPGDLSDTSALYEGEKHRLRWAWDLAFFYIPLTDDRDVCEDQEPFGAGLVHVLLGSSWVPQGTAPALCQAVPVFCPKLLLLLSKPLLLVPAWLNAAVGSQQSPSAGQSLQCSSIPSRRRLSLLWP